MTGETSKKDEGGMSMTFQCPILNSTNYTIWAVKIKALFNVYGIWDALEPKGEVDTKTDTMAIAYLFQALPEQLILQVAHHTNAADIWKDLKARFVGIDKVKEARLQTLESEFETLKMKDSESLDEFTRKISQLVSQASNLGSTIENKRLVRKLLGSVPTKFIQIVAAIEQFADLNTMTFQEATERLKAYEERIKRPRKKMYMIDFYTPKQSKRNKKNSIVVNVVVIGSRIRKEEEVNFAQYEDDEPVVAAPLL
ncbi:hypothetical protein Tco_0804677 [Tanacetum coccineum]|uniref:Zinc finger, CCHC-type n=1 Tax=Tanacetum coccineum TaxID=301880 RepID=A0ABQ5A4Z8_9ASTR